MHRLHFGNIWYCIMIVSGKVAVVLEICFFSMLSTSHPSYYSTLYYSDHIHLFIVIIIRCSSLYLLFIHFRACGFVLWAKNSNNNNNNNNRDIKKDEF